MCAQRLACRVSLVVVAGMSFKRIEWFDHVTGEVVGVVYMPALRVISAPQKARCQSPFAISGHRR